MAGTTQPTHPRTCDSAEKRFAKGLVFDVLKVLEDHGYGPLGGPEAVDLMLHLHHFLFGESESCMGRTRRQESDDVAKHRAAIDRKVEALRASEAATEAAMACYDEQEARRHARR